MASHEFEVTFDTREEAEAWSRKYARDAWAYDPIIKTPRQHEGKWIVGVNERTSCD